MKSYSDADGAAIQSAQVSSRKSVALDRCGNLTIAVRAPGGAGVPRESQREAVSASR
jgi:hypothetical protein